MRTLLKVKLDVEASNKAIMDGTLAKTVQSAIEKLKPEAAYFYAMEGCRACLMVFDMKDPSEIPSIAEPFFLSMNAQVDLYPVMNADDLKKGLRHGQNRPGNNMNVIGRKKKNSFINIWSCDHFY